MFNFMLSGTHDTFCPSSGWPRKRCLMCSLHLVSKLLLVWHTPSHIHMVYTIHQGFSGLFFLEWFSSLVVDESSCYTHQAACWSCLRLHVGREAWLYLWVLQSCFTVYFCHTGHDWYPGYCSENCFGRSKSGDGKQICPQNIVFYNSIHISGTNWRHTIPHTSKLTSVSTAHRNKLLCLLQAGRSHVTCNELWKEVWMFDMSSQCLGMQWCNSNCFCSSISTQGRNFDAISHKLNLVSKFDGIHKKAAPLISHFVDSNTSTFMPNPINMFHISVHSAGTQAP